MHSVGFLTWNLSLMAAKVFFESESIEDIIKTPNLAYFPFTLGFSLCFQQPLEAPEASVGGSG